MRQLTAEQLTRMRSTVQGNFPDTATISRPSSTKNSRGEAESTYSNAATNVACRIVIDSKASEGMSGEQLRSYSGYRVYFPTGTSVLAKDRIITGSLTLEVVESFDAHSNRVAVMAVCVRAR